MNSKILYSTVITIISLLYFTACDNDINSIGQDLQPESDDIIFAVDEVQVTAKTVPFLDYITVESPNAILGETNDPLLGRLKADFLAEYYCANAGFVLGYDDKLSIDSVHLQMAFADGDFIGDSINPMVVSVYELTENLKPNFNTNVDPSKYCDLSTVLGQRFFSVRDLIKIEGGQVLTVELDKEYGQNLYNKWEGDEKVLSNSDELRKFMKGIYVTSDLNDNAMLKFGDANTSIRTIIYYSYQVKEEKEDGGDTIYTRMNFLPLPIAAEAIKLNRVVNSSWDELTTINPDIVKGDQKTFIKAPAGVVTELTIPLGEIKQKGISNTNSDSFTVNSAIFKLTGFTEEEKNLSITSRPKYLLVIDKDSIDNFLTKKEGWQANLATLTLERDSINNSYNFRTSSVTNNNLSLTINHYLQNSESVDKDELTFLVIPIDVIYSSSSTTAITTGIECMMQPAAAIFRTDEKNMKMTLAFSKHNEVK